VVAVDLVHVVCICPICGKFHQHGSCGDITRADYGSRVPHCGDEGRCFRGQYELVTTPSTIRRKKLRTQDIGIWRDEQKDRRAILLEERRSREAAEIDGRILEAIRHIHAHGERLERWRIAREACVNLFAVTRWMHARGVFFGDGRYQAVVESRAGPELREFFPVVA